mmetsp:Transcript_2631/g.16909  ORF Transcript_2631/g.16909 Transcript_2631/m.16909 type:complete len:166 (-) Transcript_2631:1352-1849(-)
MCFATARIPFPLRSTPFGHTNALIGKVHIHSMYLHYSSSRCKDRDGTNESTRKLPHTPSCITGLKGMRCISFLSVKVECRNLSAVAYDAYFLPGNQMPTIVLVASHGRHNTNFLLLCRPQEWGTSKIVAVQGQIQASAWQQELLPGLKISLQCLFFISAEDFRDD